MPPRCATPETYTPKHLADRILASRADLEGERKQVTVLFADVVGSTELIRDLDPEDARALLEPAVRAMIDAVHRFEGTVCRVMGDGVMALFGAPLAHEDHAAQRLSRGTHDAGGDPSLRRGGPGASGCGGAGPGGAEFRRGGRRLDHQ